MHRSRLHSVNTTHIGGWMGAKHAHTVRHTSTIITHTYTVCGRPRISSFCKGELLPNAHCAAFTDTSVWHTQPSHLQNCSSRSQRRHPFPLAHLRACLGTRMHLCGAHTRTHQCASLHQKRRCWPTLSATRSLWKARGRTPSSPSRDAPPTAPSCAMMLHAFAVPCRRGGAGDRGVAGEMEWWVSGVRGGRVDYHRG